jgi:hypothetical protein
MNTPGPWKVAPGQFIVADCIGGDPSTGKIVAEVPCQGCNPDDLPLIAAAPALLAACETVLPFLRDLVKRPRSSASAQRIGSDAEDSLRVIEAVIAAATKETPCTHRDLSKPTS